MTNNYYNRIIISNYLQVRFEIGDVTKHEYPNGYFDVIYSRDALLHVPNKKALFNKFKVNFK